MEKEQKRNRASQSVCWGFPCWFISRENENRRKGMNSFISKEGFL